MKVDIMNELSSKRVEQKKKLETEIQDTILTDVKMLLETNASEEKQVLEQMGMDTHIRKAQDLLGHQIEMEKLETEHGAVYGIEDIERLCLKYNLRLLPTKYYTGHISGDLAAHILRFNKANNVMPNGYDKDRFFIMAPGKLFQLSNKPEPDFDPVMFYQISGYQRHSSEPKRFKIVHKWGNDFTVARLISGFMNRNAVNKFLTRWFFIALATKFVVSFFGVNLGIIGTVLASTLPALAYQLIILAQEDDSLTHGSAKMWNSPYKDKRE